MGCEEQIQDAMEMQTELLPETAKDETPKNGTIGSDQYIPISKQDLDQIWKWNATIPDQEQGCVHDLIYSWAKSEPDALAVCAWDGDFTYAQLDRLASNLATRLLRKLKANQRTTASALETEHSPSIVPILFNKSRWTPVAMLGIIKAGCAVIALDATMPDGRLRSIVEQARPGVMVSSLALGARAKSLIGDETSCFQLDETFLETLDTPENGDMLPVVAPSDIVYITFTSGSTGQPKGALISHANVCSAVRHQGRALGFHRGARVFDFAPYSFDVAWSNFLHTLCAGGCLCIASEAAMLDDLSGAITALRATLVNITPTVLGTLREVPACLESVLLSGEMPYPDNVAKWAGRVRLLNTYGPSECTFKCAFSVLCAGKAGERPDIGKGVGFATWLVDPLDCTRLVPIGDVGELYLEGPLVGQGYLNDPQKTAAAFVSGVPWLLGHEGRSSGKLYKTGDLVRYKPDGTLSFIGRKDASQQLKIRGQRVEIGDVEHHIRSWLDQQLSVIVDIIAPRGSDRASLALFIAVDDKTQQVELDRVVALIDGLIKHLQVVLPAFMIPTVYLPVHEIPVTPTGKVNRRLLVETGNALTWETIMAMQKTILPNAAYQEPSTAIEQQLRDIWAQILGLDASTISMGDDFLRLGGDSIAAMGVVAACREVDLVLAVADLFKTPVLKDLASITRCRLNEQARILPFSCLKQSGKEESWLKEEAARLCGVSPAEIEDVFPCTPLQEGMLAMTGDGRGQRQTSYVSRTAYKLPAEVDVARFENAWARTVELAAIVRTRIIELAGEGLVQVVLKCSPVLVLKRYSDINVMFDVAGADHPDMRLGTPLCRAGLVENAISGRIFVLEMHHAIFDGWSTALILDTVEAAYHQQPLRPFTPFQLFLNHVSATNGSSAAVAYWQDQLSNSEATIFPPLNESSYAGGKKLDLTHKVSNLQWLPHKGITPASVVRSALSLLLAQYTNSDDIKYGATVSGRNAAFPGIERVAGPTIATVPVRVKFDWVQTTVESLMQQVQRQAIECTEYEQVGLQNISRIDAQMAEASRFQLLLVVQPAPSQTKGDGALFAQAMSILGTAGSHHPLTLVTKDAEADRMGMYNSYAIMVIAQLQDDGLTFNINFDSEIIDQHAVQRMACHLEHLVRQLCTDALAGSKVCEIMAASADEVRQVWELNRHPPEAIEKMVTAMIDDNAAITGTEPGAEAFAVSAWDQQLTYQQLKKLSNKIAGWLRERFDIRPGSVIVLSFEKSSWLVVCMIATLKAGAVVLPMSKATSARHASEIVEAVQPKLVILGSSTSCAGDEAVPSSPFQGLVATLAIPELLQWLSNEERVVDEHWLIREEHQILCPDDPALILFSSGSTGAPKSILWTHANLSSNIAAHAAAFNVTSSTRAFQFAGYEFDVSTVETLSTLASGGCLCIPSEADRTNRLEDAIRDAKANWLCLTPSVSETLGGAEALPELRTLVFAGEKLTRKTASKWTSPSRSGRLDVYNWYGPAEASVATSCLVSQDTWKPGMIGKQPNININNGRWTSRTWLVDPRNPDILAPIGAIAELYIEGPIIASYTGQSGASLNQQSFCSPSWLQHRHDVLGISERPCARVYKTGDLVRYHGIDGTLIFVGRKNDAQRKLRGLRVELGDIELRVQDFLAGRNQLQSIAVVAEIFCLANSDTETLALFLSPAAAETDKDAVALLKDLPVDELEDDLLGSLPAHMIPKVYIPIAKITIGRTGKTDRRRLRDIGSSLTYEALAAMQPSRHGQNEDAKSRKPTTETERTLQRLWSNIIGINQESIHAASNFLRLGGDSIGAMRLVAQARNVGLILTSRDVFEAPRLEDMARRINLDETLSPDQRQDWQEPLPVPFSLLNSSIKEVDARAQAARLCSVPEQQVVDVYPCTTLQQGLLALGTKRHGQYVSRSVLRLQPGIDAERLETAWLATVQRLPLLRTRIVDLPGQGFVQVVLKDLALRRICSGSGDVDGDVDAYVAADALEAMGPGSALCRAAIIHKQYFILTIHHCTYDGSVLKMILDELEQKYTLKSPEMPITPFKCFIQYLNKKDPQEAAAFWQSQLSSDKEPRQFPALPCVSYIPKANATLDSPISLSWPRGSGITPSTILRAAWSILATQYTSSLDVIFALTVSGRQADMRGIESCVGPTISTVPVAVTLDWNATVHGFLERLQAQMVAMTPFEHFGLQNLKRLENCLDVVDTRLLQTLLVVQPAKGQDEKSLDTDSLLFEKRSFASTLDSEGADPFNSYALMIIFELAADGVRMKTSFDNTVVPDPQMRAMAFQFEGILRQLCSCLSSNIGGTDPGQKLGSIQTASLQDLDLFWKQNHKVPADPDNSVPELISEAARQQPQNIAIDACDGKFTYCEVDKMSTELSQGMAFLGVRKGQAVGLNFEKSRWAPVTQLAVLKAGAVAVQMSVAVPPARMAKVFEAVGVVLVVVGCASTVRASCVEDIPCYTVDQILQDGASATRAGEPVVDVEMQDPAAIIVSSGSTGEPKQIGWSHRALAANVRTYGHFAGLTASTRVFQFASYDFDVATVESMAVLAYGSCLCIPSEAERLDGTAGAIRKLEASLLSLTPSVAKSLAPEDMPLVETVVFAGENLTRDDVVRWGGTGKECRVMNWYGPAEQSGGTWTCVDDDTTWHSGVIGNINSRQMQPSLCWLVDPTNHDRLAPFGAVGELVLEGPQCADGYIGNPTLTERHFRRGLEFLAAGHTMSTGNTTSTQVIPGRRGRIFISGDLARFDASTGNLVYMGRKDKQLKVRGQLVAPEEVQQQIRKHLVDVSDEVTVVVDVIQSSSSKANTAKVLVAFVGPATEDQIESATAGLREKLAAVLPTYAIPVYYIPIASFPRNASAKLDNHRLRQIGAAFDPSRQLAGLSGTGNSIHRRDPTTTAERTLRELWSATLGIDAEQIKAGDSFLRVGDSIQAMRLVGMARQQRLKLTVAEVFENPTLEDMAKVLTNLDGVDDFNHITAAIPPFSLLNPDQDVQIARQHAASCCDESIEADDIEDIFPCTSLQEGLLALTIKNQEIGLGNAYIGHNILELAPSVDRVRFRESWDRVVELFSILRTRIIELPGHGLVQAIVHSSKICHWMDELADGSFDQWMAKEKNLSMGLGTPLMRCALLVDHGNNYFGLSMHHSIYDGQTTPMILEALKTTYHGTSTPLRHAPFQAFVKYISEQDKSAQANFWRHQFQNLEAEQFPALPTPQYQPQTDSTLSQSFNRIPWRQNDNTTPSTIIRAATALLCAQYSGNSSDVVFGAVSAGRRAPVGGIERLAGPTIATMPIRVTLAGGNMQKLLDHLQTQAVAMIPHEQTGLSAIRQVGGPGAELACQFQTLLVVQPAQENMTMIGDSNCLFVSEYDRRSPSEGESGIIDEEDVELARHHSFQSYALSLICVPDADRLKVTFCFDSVVIPREMVQRMAQGFEHFIRILCSPDRAEITAPLPGVVLTTRQDISQIWRWNLHSAHPNVDSCVHDLITQIAKSAPNSVAIRAWDGEMTYAILDRVTTNLARRWVSRNGRGLRGITVPLCFEKSIFAVVALLSVIKAGGAGLLLDTTLAEDRLLGMVQQVKFGGGLVLSSSFSQRLAEKLAGMNATVEVVGRDELDAITRASDNGKSPRHENHPLPRVHSSDLICTIFTSGSTGKPKACLLTHGNFSSAVTHQRSTLQLDHTSRMFDFASHAFDATYWAAFHVLTAGGTLCIPSDEDRKTRLTESMAEFGTTHLFLTPSVARLVDPSRVPTLKSVHLGGEEVTEDDVSRWQPYTKDGGTFVAYGPSECTAGTLYYRVPEPLTDGPLSIGKGVGASTWIVKPRSTDQDTLSLCHLCPIGTVGELYLEGPLVGQGYLGDENAGKTAASFIQCPAWILEGRGEPFHNDGGEKKSRLLYKTGDLVKYDPAGDGNIIFLGRKDRQVKLRGQKVELADVEHYLRKCLASTSQHEWCKLLRGAAVEVVTPSVTETPTLVAFLQLNQLRGAPGPELLNQLSDYLEASLPELLPPHMVPAAYVAVESIPLSASGKTDRKHLLKMGQDLTLDQLKRHTTETPKNGLLPVALTEWELVLRELWTAVLPVVKADDVHKDSSFLRMGGDSISAMRLTALAKSRGIKLPVKDILQMPRLSEMTTAMKITSTTTENAYSHEGTTTIIQPFSLLKSTHKNEIIDYISTHNPDINASQIEDVYPCTSVQKSLLSMTAKSASGESYVARFSIPLSQDTDIARFKRAWEHVSRQVAPILRTRIVDVLAEGGLVQVQLDEGLEWCEELPQNDNEKEKTRELVVARYLAHDRKKPMGLGTPLTRLAIVDGICFVTQHHAVYDGYSVRLLLKEVSKAYSAESAIYETDSSRIVAPFQAFIKHVLDIDQEQATLFWTQQFAESEAVPFPALPSEDYRPKADNRLKMCLSNVKWPKFNTDATASTIIRAAWSILTARYTGSPDVVFGAIVSGRQAPLDSIDHMIAPLISAVPVRVSFNPEQSLDKLLGDIQRQALAMIAYEQVELLDIRRMSAEAERGSRFNTLLVVQPATPGGDDEDEEEGNKKGPWQRQTPEFISDGNGLDDFNPNAVMIMCQLTNSDSLELEISFDSHLIDAEQMRRIGVQFEHVLRQICVSPMETSVKKISTLSTYDLDQLWTWNGDTAPGPVEDCVHHLIRTTMASQPCAPAICAWDGNLSYGELDQLSGFLAQHLTSLGAGPGCIIPLCFEKSMWYPVAVLGAMRAGAACVAMDSTQPVERLQSIVAQINPKFMLSSAGNQALAGRLSGARVVVVDGARVQGYEAVNSNNQVIEVNVCADDVLYVVFTSGSTGMPKGIITTHRNFASAAIYQREILQVTHTSRVFDFVSYSFDVSWSNHLQTFINGGCLCIPSETDRRNDIPGAFNRMKCDYVYFTPSVALSLEPASMPGIKVLAMGGEPILGREVARWTTTTDPAGEKRSIIGIYGPAECAQALSFVRLGGSETPDGNVGFSYGARTWLVEPGRPDQLAAIGAIGELVIEGPTVSRGYFGDPGKTATAYIQTPPWLTAQETARGTSTDGRQLYMTGDLLRYNSNGSLNFIGRKDGMVKLRGQRIELAEVEYHIRGCLRDSSNSGAQGDDMPAMDADLCDGVAAEIIKPQGSKSSLLAIFLSVATKYQGKHLEERVKSRLVHVVERLDEKMRERVPLYMIPGAYLQVAQIPMTTTNKTDRRALRALGSAQTLETLAEMQPHSKIRRTPSTAMEKQLQTLWSSVLDMDPASISADSSFLRIGGESIAAMRLVAAARREGLVLTVADIFKWPSLADLAILVGSRSERSEAGDDSQAAEAQYAAQQPFSLLKKDDPRQFLRDVVAPSIGCKGEFDVELIKDVVPATDFQELAAMQALQDPPDRYVHWIFDLPLHTDLSRLEQACRQLVRNFDILHTVFIQGDDKMWQVLLPGMNVEIETIDAADGELATFTSAACKEDLARPRNLGQSFVRFFAIKHDSGTSKLVFRISHAQFDGFSWGMVLETLSAIYTNSSVVSPPPANFSNYIAFAETKKAESFQYWSSRLQGTKFPAWTYGSGLSMASSTSPTNHRLAIKETVPMPSIKQDLYEGVSAATVFHAACAIALSRQFQQRQVVFGRLVTGRAMLPAALQNVVGPTMTEVPIKVDLDAENSGRTLSDVARRLQSQFVADSEHETVGMVEIIEKCTDWSYSDSTRRTEKDFGWRTAFQQQDELEHDDSGEISFLGGRSRVSFYEAGERPARERPEIYATPTKDGNLELEFEGDRRRISEHIVREFLAKLRVVLSVERGCHVTG